MSLPQRTFSLRLGQSAPTLNTITTLYTVPDFSPLFPNLSMTLALELQSLFVINRDSQSEADWVSVWLVPALSTPNANNILVSNKIIDVQGELIQSKIYLNSGDSIQIRSSKGLSTFHAYGVLEYQAAEEFATRGRIVELQEKVRLLTATNAEKEELVLLLGGAIQTNSNICSCP